MQSWTFNFSRETDIVSRTNSKQQQHYCMFCCVDRISKGYEQNVREFSFCTQIYVHIIVVRKQPTIVAFSENMANSNNDFVWGNCLLLNSGCDLCGFIVVCYNISFTVCCYGLGMRAHSETASLVSSLHGKLFHILQLKFHIQFLAHANSIKKLNEHWTCSKSGKKYPQKCVPCHSGIVVILAKKQTFSSDHFFYLHKGHKGLISTLSSRGGIFLKFLKW